MQLLYSCMRQLREAPLGAMAHTRLQKNRECLQSLVHGVSQVTG